MKKILIIFLLELMITSCGRTSPQVSTQKQDFPLVNVAEISSKDKIQKVAISDTWLVIQTQSDLTAIDVATRKPLWSLSFSGDLDSKFSIVNDNLIAASNKQIVIVKKLGQKRIVDLEANAEIIRLVSVYGNFLYVIQDLNWNLAIYDISKNTLLWKTSVGRGTTDVFFDPLSDIVYVTTPRSIRAFDNESGVLLWQQEKEVVHSGLDSGVLYLCEQTIQRNVHKISAINVESQREVWNKTLSVNVDGIYNLEIIKDMLIVSTRKGLVAIDKLSGDQIWYAASDDIFYTAPVEFNGVIYAKGSSRKVYAISPSDGNILGYVQMEADTAFQSKYESLVGVFLLKDGIAFNTNAAVFLFKAK